MNFNEIKDDLEWVASNEQGRHVLWEILSFCKVYHDLGGEGSNVHKDLGRREVGLHILSILDQLDDELLFSMMREAKNRQLVKEKIDVRTNREPRTDLIRDFIGGESKPRAELPDTISAERPELTEPGGGYELPSFARGGAIF